MLDVGRLRVLLAISEHGGLPAAARALGTPAADAAAQLSALERELGMPLADGDRLTPAGRRLADHAGRLLPQLEAAAADAAAVAGRPAGLLRLGVGAAAGRALLPDALATLRRTGPELELRVEQLADERVGALGADRFDVVVVGEFGAAVPRRAAADTERRELLTEPLLVAVPARHWATGVSVRLAELADERWVGGPAGGEALTALERAAATAGFEPRLVGHAGEDGLALALVAAGHGVALVPASSVPQPVEGVRFLTAVDAGLRRTVTAAVRRGAAADPGVVLLLDALGQAARRVAAAVSGVTAAAPATEVPLRRPDPLSDPLPGAGPAGHRNGTPAPELPGPRREPGAEPWAGRAAPDLPVPRRRDPQPEPLANGTGGYATSNGHGRNGSYGGSAVPGAAGGAYGGPAAPDPYRPGPVTPEQPPAEGTRPRPAAPRGGDRLLPPPGDLPYRSPTAGDAPRTGPGDLPTREPYRSPTAGDAPRTGPGDLPTREPYRPGPADLPDAGPYPTRAGSAGPADQRGLRRREATPGGALPPPGVPADRPRGGATAADRVPQHTSPDLGVRSLAAGDLPGRRAAAGRPPRRRAEPAPDSLPPAPPGSAEDVRLSIFEDLQSEWFTRRDETPAPAGAWQTAADDGWRAAARLAEPATAGTTTAGLPRRRPQALYVPGAVAGDAEGGSAPNGAATRSPQEVRGRLSSYRDGVRRGRHAEPTREDTP
nr:LysR family transcriptional regulator [uncultured bacterium]